MTEFPEAAMYKLPLASTATPNGFVMIALVAGPPFPG
jgi:hypothetical protein